MRTTTNNQPLTALALMLDIETHLRTDTSVMAMSLRSKDFSAIEKINMLKDQATDPASKPGMVRMFGEQLVTRILNY